MATGDDEPDPNPDPDPDGDDGPVLSPEELDIAEDEHVREIEEGRFVVSPEGRPADPAPGPAAVKGGADEVDPAEADATEADPAEADPAEATGTGPLDEATVHEWLRGRMAASSSRYGFDVTGTFDGTVSTHQIASNDIVTVFETMLLWYARQVDSETPVEEVIGILLMESNVPVRYPAESLQTLLDSVDVEEDDSIADLIDAVEARDGIQL